MDKFIILADIHKYNEMKAIQMQKSVGKIVNDDVTKFLLSLTNQRGSHNGYLALNINKHNVKELLNLSYDDINNLLDIEYVPYGGLTYKGDLSNFFIDKRFFQFCELHGFNHEKINEKPLELNVDNKDLGIGLNFSDYLVLGFDTAHYLDYELAEQHDKNFVCNELQKLNNGIECLLSDVNLKQNIKKLQGNQYV